LLHASNNTTGFDLQGNTFWEFKDALHALRNRRIAKYSRSTHYGDVQISRLCLPHVLVHGN